MHDGFSRGPRGPAWLRRPGGFSLVEILFAIGILGLGVVGVLSLFLAGISSANLSGSRSYAAMTAQSLYTRIQSDPEIRDNVPSGKRIFLSQLYNLFYDLTDPSTPKWRGRLTNGYKTYWIHDPYNPVEAVGANATPTPVKVGGDETDFWWACRASNFPMGLDDPLDPARDNSASASNAFPPGLVEIAIAVYRSSARTFPVGKKPVSTYTTFLTVEP